MLDDLLPEPLVRVAPDGRIERANRAARRTFGADRCEEGRPFSEFMQATCGTVDDWLAERRTTTELLPGRLCHHAGDLGLTPIAVEAGRIPGSQGSVLVRFRGEGTLQHRLLALTRQLDERRSDLRKRDQKLAELESRTEKLHRIAKIDGLTGLANRREFDNALAVEWGRAHRHSRPLGLLLIDADHFKRINDVYGHALGDDVLRELGALLAEHARRATDFVARYGGEEFAILLAESTVQHGLHTVSEIVEAVRGLELRSPDGPLRLTVSAGMAFRTPRGGSPRELVEAADEALYRAKRTGRDRWLMDEETERSHAQLDLIE